MAITITDNLTVTGTLEVTGGSQITFDDVDAILGSIVATGGTTYWGDGTITILGEVNAGSGWHDSANLTMTGTDAPYLWTMPGAKLTIADGANVTMAHDRYIKSLHGPGDLATNHRITILTPAAGWWTFTGSLTGSGNLYVSASGDMASPGGDIVSQLTGPLLFANHTTGTLTMDGKIDISGGLTIYGSGSGDWMAVHMAEHNLTCGDIQIGQLAGTDTSGKLSCGNGIANIGNVAGHATGPSANEFNFDGGNIAAVGKTLNLANMTSTAASANLVGGTLTSATVTGILNTWGTLDGGGNTGDIIRHGGAEIGNPLAGIGGLAA